MKEWNEIETEYETVNWQGEPIVLRNVKALQNAKTKQIRIRPYELAQAEIALIAKKSGILPRDVTSLMMMFAKPGIFNAGEVFYKYHLQKMLFYLWKELRLAGYVEAMPRDEFIPAKNGPKPEHMNDDLERFEKEGLIFIKEEYWHPETEKPSKRIFLTNKGMNMAKEIWLQVPEPYRITAIKVKERLHPMDPENVRHMVHKEYPEYEDTYVENDIE